MQRLLPPTLARDLPASVVVFLVALPLCLGIAVASGVPAAKGLMTGMIGGIVVGALAGSPLQVSGPAAGLITVVADIVHAHGLACLGAALMGAGLLQIAAGFARLGRWFRAISPAVVHGMLAGIGVLIVAGQLHVMLDRAPASSGLANIASLPACVLRMRADGGVAACICGITSILAMLFWERVRPASLRLVPGALVGVIAGSVTGAALHHVRRVSLPASPLAPSYPAPHALAGLAPQIALAAVTIAFIASAESLLSAEAVDRMHRGARTDRNRELMAQGIGNLLCGLVGGLPMTGVIVRSSANVQAGAATRLSAILHGIWLLALVALCPGVLGHVPKAALAGVLVVVGARLAGPHHLRVLIARLGLFPALLWLATMATVVATSLLTGVLVGLALSALEILGARGARPFGVRVIHGPDSAAVILTGAAIFPRLPRLLEMLEGIPARAPVRLHAGRLAFVDHTCLEAIVLWAARRAEAGGTVTIDRWSRARRTRLAAALSGRFRSLTARRLQARSWHRRRKAQPPPGRTDPGASPRPA